MGRPFGGAFFVYTRDFQRVLQVVFRGTVTKILEQCIKRSSLWIHFKVYYLTGNMCANEEGRKFAN